MFHVVTSSEDESDIAIELADSSNDDIDVSVDVSYNVDDYFEVKFASVNSSQLRYYVGVIDDIDDDDFKGRFMRKMR